MSRGVSTVADVAVFFLLLSAAVGTLALEAHPPALAGEAGRAAATADALATTTVTIEGRSAAGAAGSGPTLHGTPAGLLARAAVRSATAGGRALFLDRPAVDAALEAEARRIAARRAPRTRVRAVWMPYPDAVLAGRVAVGPEPPATADTDAAVVRVPLGIDAARRTDPRRAAERDGFRGVARIVARTVVRRAFPPARTRRALLDDRERVRRRYRRAASALDADLGEALAAADAERANRRLAAALAERVERDLRARYDRPGAAADALELDSVRVVVRTWSP